MFGELPAWGVFIRHARDVQFNGLSINAVKADFRTAIVLDDVQQALFRKTTIKEPERRKVSIVISHLKSL